jgi:hypothetical protein
MYCFDIEATPKPDSPQAEEVGSALVNCWVDFPLRDGAELLARFYIAEDGNWEPGETKGWNWMEEEDFVGQPQLLECFHVARKAGMCLLFHTFPPRTCDDDEPVN